MSWPPTSLNATQLANARIIVEVGQRLGASARDQQIALMTAMQESELTNMTGGDRDSVGLFQQRAAWAPASDRMDPYKSAAMFFQGGQEGQRGLLAFKNRDQMSLTQAAQAVQVSAYPQAYAKWESLATKYMPELGVKAEDPAATAGVSENATTMAVAPAPPTPTATTATTATAPAPGATGIGEAAASATGIGVASAAAVGVAPTATPTEVQPAPVDQQVLAPTGPNTSGLMSRQQFNDLFPAAAATKQFSGPATKAANMRRSDAITNAMSYVGTPYKWGGNGYGGVDCSGLVQQVYKSFGVDVPRLSADQIRAGKQVTYADLKPGDLIGWDLNNRNYGADHIAIYAGSGQIIEAPRPGIPVRKRALTAHDIETGLFSHFSQFD